MFSAYAEQAVIPTKNFVSFAKQNFTNYKSGASLSSESNTDFIDKLYLDELELLDFLTTEVLV